MTDAHYYQLNVGDCIEQPLFRIGNWKHVAVYVGCISGIEWMVQNQPSTGVCFITAEEFFGMLKAGSSIRPFVGTEEQRNGVQSRALALLGTPYDLFHFNCEHFVSFVQYQQVTSPQLARTLLLAGVILFGF